MSHPSGRGIGNIAILTAIDLTNVRATAWLATHPTTGSRPGTPFAGYGRLVRSAVVELASCPTPRGRRDQTAVRGELATRQISMGEPHPAGTTSLKTGKRTTGMIWHAGCSCCRVRGASPEALHAWNRQRKDDNPSHRLRLTPRSDWRRAMNSRTSGRKNALLKRPMGGCGSR